MKKKTILFFPTEVGIAHITRSLAVAEALQEKGHVAIVAIPKRKQVLFAKSPVKIVTIPSAVHTDSLDIIRKYENTDWVEKMTREDLALVKKYEPDTVICDFRVSSVVAGFITNTPTVFLSQGAGLPKGIVIPNVGWPKIVDPLMQSIMQRLVWRIKLPLMQTLVEIVQRFGKETTVDELYDYMTYLLPEPNEYLTPLDTEREVFQCGPLFWNGFSGKTPKWLSTIKPDGKTIYVSFGGTGFDTEKLKQIVHTLLEKGFRTVVSTSSLIDPLELGKHKNLFAQRYIDGFKVAKRVDVVICHGGYGTLMQAVLSGTPVVSIPFNPDQVVHAIRFHELGIGRSLHRINVSFFKNMTTGDWLGFEKQGSAIGIERVLKEVQYVLKHQKQFRLKIQEVTKSWDYKNSARKAADFIESK